MRKQRSRRTHTGITEGKLKVSLWKLAMPMMASALLHDLFSLIDLFFIGKLGVTPVAALSISGAILSVILMAAIGISAGTTALIAHFIGKRDYGAADKVLAQSVIISIACSLMMFFVGMYGTVPLLKAFGAEPSIIPAAAEYLKINFTWSIVLFLSLAFNQALRGSGDAVTPLKILLLTNLTNIILDPLFIFGIGVFPRMEVAGSALATVISRSIGVIILLYHFIFRDSTLHFRKEIFRVDLLLAVRMLKIGFFASIEVLLRQVSLLLLVRLVASFGVACLAAYGIAIRLRMGMMMFGIGMGISASILIGQNMGANNPQRAARSGLKALKYYEFIVVPLAFLMFILSAEIIALFNSGEKVVEIGSSFLRFVALGLPFLASALVLGKGVTGAGDTIAPASLTGIIQVGMRIPLAYLLALLLNFGTTGIWMGVCASDIFQGAIMFWYFKGGLWKKRYHKHRAILEGRDLVAL